MRLLFLCTHNACRSILAESIARGIGGDLWQMASAGSHPAGRVHPATLEALDRHGYRTERLLSKSWDDLIDHRPDLVITVCDQPAGETCPIWFGQAVNGHWGLPDPSREADDARRNEAFDRIIGTLEGRLKRLAERIRQGASHSELADAVHDSATIWV